MRGADRGMRRLDQRRFAHAARAPQQRIIGRQAAGEALGIFDQEVAHAVDALEERHVDTVDAANRRELAAFRVPDEGLGGGEIERRRRRPGRAVPARRRSGSATRHCRRRGEPAAAPPCRAVFFVAFFLERGGDLAIFAPGCGHPLSGAAARSQASPRRARNIAIGPTAAIVRAILRAKAALHPGRRAFLPAPLEEQCSLRPHSRKAIR